MSRTLSDAGAAFIAEQEGAVPFWYDGGTMTRFDREGLAWAAGFFDGEGSFLAAKGKDRTPSLRVSISNTYRPTIERFQTAVGMGTIFGPYSRTLDRPNQRPFWQFYVGGHEAYQAVGCMLWPWLSGEKRQQFLDALAAWTDAAPRRWACPKDHPRAGNTYVSPKGHIGCRTCRAEGRPAAKRRREAAARDGAER